MKLENAMRNGKTVSFEKNPELKELLEKLVRHLESQKEEK